MAGQFDVYLETGSKRVFASAVDWPGWSRGGKTVDEALAALAIYGSRYAATAKRAGVRFLAPKSVDEFSVVARHQGGAGTDFGVPSLPAPSDSDDLDASELKRWRALLKGAWATWDLAAEAAVGVTLSVGPRGGGRSLEKMRTHVLEAEESYLMQLGTKRPRVEGEAKRMAAVRADALQTLDLRAKHEPLPNPNQVKKLWSPRYYVRRSAWHVLDHAWELEDRSNP